MSLKKKIIIPLFYKVITGFIILVIIMMSILIISSRMSVQGMKSYFVQRIDDNNNKVIEEINQNISDNNWEIGNADLKILLDKLSRSYDLEFDLVEPDGKVLYEIRRNKQRPEPNEYKGPEIKGFDVQLLERVASIDNNGTAIGSIKIIYYDASMMTPEDIRFFEFIDATFKYLTIATVLVGLMISYIMARSITRPLNKVCETAHDIRLGHLDARTSIRTNTKELIELSEAINYLADTLEKEDGLRKQVTSDMAHELRTPLTALRNFFEAFMDGIYETSEENLMKCHQEIIRLSDLVDRLKDVASIEEMSMKVNKTTFDLSSHVKDITEWFNHEFEKKEIEVAITVPEKVEVMMDLNHMKQILTNLLSNALRYSDARGMVQIRVIDNPDSVLLEVEDNGIGIDEKDLPLIFERFYRADKSRDRATGGIGVGLTIVKKLVTLNGGKIEVESKINQGTLFRVMFKKSII